MSSFACMLLQTVLNLIAIQIYGCHSHTSKIFLKHFKFQADGSDQILSSTQHLATECALRCLLSSSCSCFVYNENDKTPSCWQFASISNEGLHLTFEDVYCLKGMKGMSVIPIPIQV